MAMRGVSHNGREALKAVTLDKVINKSMEMQANIDRKLSRH
jgi:hypothetical protein